MHPAVVGWLLLFGGIGISGDPNQDAEPDSFNNFASNTGVQLEVIESAGIDSRARQDEDNPLGDDFGAGSRVSLDVNNPAGGRVSLDVNVGVQKTDDPELEAANDNAVRNLDAAPNFKNRGLLRPPPQPGFLDGSLQSLRSFFGRIF